MRKEIEPYEQRTSFTCGAASLVIAYRALGINISEEILISEMRITQEGVTWPEIVENLVDHGFGLKWYVRANYKELKQDFKKGVVIVAWNTDWSGEPGGHYSVVSGITNDLIELTDPGIPVQEWPSIMTKDEFLAKWDVGGVYSNSYILIKPK